jgi:4-diphosphocytidyl-2-C-methyl-D-erythritol kinase
MPEQLFSPAKINLGIAIFGKRSDGYHEVQNVLMTLPPPIGDTLIVEEQPAGAAARIEIICEREEVPTDEQNFLWQVFEKMSVAAGKKTGIKIWLKKQL